MRLFTSRSWTGTLEASCVTVLVSIMLASFQLLAPSSAPGKGTSDEISDCLSHDTD
jgi:hypothetical protein